MRRIKELFDKPVPYQIVKSTRMGTNNQMGTVAKFEVDGLHYKALWARNEYVYSPSGVILGPWELTFFMDQDEVGDKYGISGAGNQFTVFATIAAFMIETVKKYNLDEFCFSAKEPSRIKLYKVFADLISKKLGYKYTEKYISTLESKFFIFYK